MGCLVDDGTIERAIREARDFVGDLASSGDDEVRGLVDTCSEAIFGVVASKLADAIQRSNPTFDRDAFKRSCRRG